VNRRLLAVLTTAALAISLACTAARPTLATSPTLTRPAVTAAPGLCSNPQMTTQAVIERYFELSTSKDAQAVGDCFAKSWRASFSGSPTWDDVARAWASAGPATGLRISYGGAANGCDRYGVAALMSSGHPIGQSGSEFITVGSEGGTPRIFEIGTAVVSAQFATTTCR